MEISNKIFDALTTVARPVKINSLSIQEGWNYAGKGVSFNLLVFYNEANGVETNKSFRGETFDECLTSALQFFIAEGVKAKVKEIIESSKININNN